MQLLLLKLLKIIFLLAAFLVCAHFACIVFGNTGTLGKVFPTCFSNTGALLEKVFPGGPLLQLDHIECDCCSRHDSDSEAESSDRESTCGAETKHAQHVQSATAEQRSATKDIATTSCRGRETHTTRATTSSPAATTTQTQSGATTEST